MMLEIAGGILIAAAVIGLVVMLFTNPDAVLDVAKFIGGLVGVAWLLFLLFAHAG